MTSCCNFSGGGQSIRRRDQECVSTVRLALELGHTVDIVLAVNNTKPSDLPLYSSYLTKDRFDLDNVLDVSSNVIARLPCQKTDLGNNVETTSYPFQGVMAVKPGTSDTLIPVCNANGLPNDDLLVSGTWGATKPTDVLDVIISGLVIKGVPELHAQTFAWQAVGSGGARPAFDGILDNKVPDGNQNTVEFFNCLKSWASTLQSMGAVPVGSCSIPTPK